MFVRKERGFLFRGFSIVGVSLYLAVVYLWLRCCGNLRPEFPIWKLFTRLLSRCYVGDLSNIHAESGHCYTAAIPEYLVSDADGISRVRVFEDGLPLKCSRADHQLIRKVGGGAFSHWGRFIYFSSTDNTDPRANGRRYAIKEV